MRQRLPDSKISDEAMRSLVARQLIEDNTTVPFLSVASPWEMAVKISLGKMTVGIQSFETFIPEQMSRNDIAPLDIIVWHVARVAVLPLAHRDPFDRMLIAQAITEELPIISADSILDAYPVTRVR